MYPKLFGGWNLFSLMEAFVVQSHSFIALGILPMAGLAGSQIYSSETLQAGVDTLEAQGIHVKTELSPDSRAEMEKELEDSLHFQSPACLSITGANMKWPL